MNRFKVQKPRVIKFLLSISFLYVSFSIIPLFQSLKPFLSMFLIDKSYMFLLCNGLVVFILKNSGLFDVNKGSEIENNNPLEVVAEEKDQDHHQERSVSDEEDEEEEGIDHAIVAIDEEEEEEEDTEELNQKVEEFIRKMKDSISLERRLLQYSDYFDAQQVVAVQY